MKKVMATVISLFLMKAGAGAQWRFAIPEPKPLFGKPDTVEVCIIGDVMMHMPQLEHNYSEFFERVAGPMRNADISIANMEFTLAGEPYSGYPFFSAPDEYAATLCNQLELDLLLTANNHILDKGIQGANRTIEVYRNLHDSTGVEYTGIWKENEPRIPAVLSRRGIRIAFVNFTYGTNCPAPGPYPKVARMNKGEVSSSIEYAKEQKADFIVALPHWGEEYHLKHSQKQEEWADWLAGQGVCAIVGSHPHVVQDTVMIGNVPVIYSIGNAVSNQSRENTRLELMVTLRFTIDHQTGEKSMLEPVIRYMWCTLPNTLTPGYATIFVDEWADRASEWIDPSDYENMMSTMERVSNR